MKKWVCALGMFVGLSVVGAPYVASTLTNTVVMHNKTTAAQVDLSVTADNLKPAECAGITLTAVVSSETTSDVTGTTANELLLGAPANATFNGGAGDDCVVVPNTGAVTIDGGDGNDVCLGNSDTTFLNCETKYVNGILQP